jgi:hypothetical protein
LSVTVKASPPGSPVVQPVSSSPSSQGVASVQSRGPASQQFALGLVSHSQGVASGQSSGPASQQFALRLVSHSQGVASGQYESGTPEELGLILPPTLEQGAYAQSNAQEHPPEQPHSGPPGQQTTTGEPFGWTTRQLVPGQTLPPLSPPYTLSDTPAFLQVWGPESKGPLSAARHMGT